MPTSPLPTPLSRLLKLIECSGRFVEPQVHIWKPVIRAGLLTEKIDLWVRGLASHSKNMMLTRGHTSHRAAWLLTDIMGLSQRGGAFHREERHFTERQGPSQKDRASYRMSLEREFHSN